MKFWLGLLIPIFAIKLAVAASCAVELGAKAELKFENGSNLVVHIPETSLPKLSQRLSKIAEARVNSSEPRTLSLEKLQPVISDLLKSESVQKYLMGFSPTVNVGDFSYQAKLSHVAVTVNSEGSSQNGKGLFLEVEIALDSLNAESSNANVSLFGSNKAKIGYTKATVNQKEALKLKIPLYLEITAKNQLDVKIQELDPEILKSLSLQVEGFRTPQVEILIDGEKVPMFNSSLIASMIKDHVTANHLHDLAEKLTSPLVQFLNQGLASFFQRRLNAENAEYQKRLLELQVKLAQVMRQNPANVNPIDVSIKPTHIRQQEDQTISAGVEIQVGRQSRPNKDSVCSISCLPYDVAIATKKTLLEDIARNLWSSGYFSRLRLSSGDVISLVSAPTLVSFGESHTEPGKSILTLGLKARPDSSLGVKIFARERFSVDMNLTLAVSTDGSNIKVEFVTLKANKIAFNESDLRLPFRLAAAMTPNFVINAIQSLIVAKISSKIRASGQFVKTIPLDKLGEVSDWLGELNLSGLGIDPQGHIFLLLNLK